MCLEATAESTEPAGSSKAGGSSGAPAGKDDLGQLARKLNNPLSDVWVLQVEFDWTLKKGDITDGSYKNQYAMIFQPVLPILLTEKFNLITRPVVPVISTEIPEPTATGDIDFDRKNGLGDIILPLLFSPKSKGNWVWAVGPTFSFPTATNVDLGSEKWEAGPAAALIYKTKELTVGAFGQYWWDYAGDDDRSSVSRANLLYFFWYMLPGQWQICMNPTILYDNEAMPDDRWNVPIGLTVGKMTRIGKLPIKFQAGFDYSVIHEDDFGDRWKFKFLLTPVIPALIKKALFK